MDACGIFVGGRGRRMGGGGVAKGLLVAPDGVTILARQLALAERAGLGVALVGAHEAYDNEGVPMLPDAAEGAGPLGGLVSLFAWAAARGAERVVVLACDMPFVTDAILALLLAAPPAPAVAPKTDGFWEPFFSRWSVAEALPAARAQLDAGVLPLQRLLDAIGARELVLGEAERRALRDWDEPADMT